MSRLKREDKKFNFTQKAIEAILPPQKKLNRDEIEVDSWMDYQDTQSRFLYLRVRSSGRKTFFYVRRIDGNTIWKKLDTFPEMTVFLAREQCVRISGDYARSGDPADLKRRSKEIITFDQLFQTYMELHAKPMKRTWKWDELNYRNHLKSLEKKNLKDITPDVISRLHKTIGAVSGQTQANRVLALLKTVFNFGIKHQFITGVNPAFGVAMFREKSRERFMDGNELQRFFQALEKDPDKDIKDFFLLALYTGARRGNLQAMKWGQVDLDQGIWTIPGEESKNRESMKVILAPPAIEILSSRKGNPLACSEYVFPSRQKKSKTPHLVEPRKAWARICKAADLHDLRIHDLRRTLGSWQAASGSSLHVIGKSLGHRNQSTTAIYSRLDLDPVRVSVNRAIAAMMNRAMEPVNNE